MRAMDLISAIGVVLTLIGLAFSIYEARRARIASIDAKEAAELAREASLRSAAVIDLSHLIKALSELKTLHRACALEVLPGRYEALRLSVISLRQVSFFSNNDAQKALQSLISRLTGVERLIDQGISVEKFMDGVPRLNSQITKSIEQLQVYLVDSVRTEK